MRIVAALALTALTLTGCKEFKGIQIDTRVLIPKDATFVVGFEAQAIADSPLKDPLLAAMNSDKDMASMVTAFGACELDATQLRGIVAMDSEVNTMFAVIETPRIGEDSVVRCLEKQYAKQTGEASGLILFENRGKVRVAPQDDGSHLIMLNKNAVVIVDKAWEQGVFEAIEHEDARSSNRELSKIAAGIDPTTDLWFAFEPTDSDRASFTDIPGLDHLAGVRATADLTSGLKLDLAFKFGGDAEATVFHEALVASLEALAPTLEESGLPANLLDGVKPRMTSGFVNAKLDVAADEFPGLVTAILPLLAE